MRTYKILAMIYRDLLIYRKTKWKLFEFIILPVLGFSIWGLASLYIRDLSIEFSLILIIITILLQFAQTNQSGINSQIMADMWSASFKHIIASGITAREYITARAISASIASSIMTAITVSPCSLCIKSRIYSIKYS